MTQPQKRDQLVITRVFNVSREQVWKAWTQPEQLKKWLSPKGFSAPFSSIDLRVGGRYLNSMRGPDGKDIWSTGVYREVVPPERLVMTDSFADEKGEVVSATYYGLGSEFPRELQITLTLDKEEDKTKLTLKHAGINNLSEKDVSDIEQGWNESLDKLAAHLEASASKQL